ncbi:MAG: PQQ-like beta-propeller repeat protein [Verrucomicrobia bacterium]|nr:PQQ-like beta-propeller repeat protein [Verrucomicrobiota bacterium]
MTKLCLVGGGLAVLCLSQPLLAADGDWPQWRGPNRDDLSTEKGLLKQWPADGPPLAWKVTGLGAGYSGVSLVGPRLFTMGDKADGNYVLAFNRADGKPLWSAKLGKAGAPGWGGFAGPRGTPTVDGDLVFALGQYGEVICVNAADGKEIWHKHLTADFGGPLMQWGFSESPLVDGDQVMLTPGGPKGTVVALNKKSGDLVWQSKDWTDTAHYSSIIIAEIGGVRQYVQLTDKSVAGLSPKDGSVLWKAARKGATAVIPTPIVADDQVYVTSGYSIGCNLFKVAKGSGFSATQVYANKVMANHHGGVIKIGDFLYGHSEGKGWTCQNFKTGEAVWQEKDKLKKGSVAFADGMLYCREEDSGIVALVAATPTGYSEKGRFKQPDRAKEKSWPHPVIAGGKLYLRDQDALFCYDVKAR